MRDRLSKKLVNFIQKFRALKYYQIAYGILLIVILIISALFLVTLSPYRAGAKDEFVKAKVLSVYAVESASGTENVRAEILQGPDKGRVVSVARSYFMGDLNSKRLPKGSVVLLNVEPKNGNQYSFLDRYRLNGVLTILAILTILVFAIGRWRGLTAAVGLVFTIDILAIFVLPRIVAGDAAFATCIEGAFMIATLTIFIAHGFRRRTIVAFISTILTLIIIVGLSALAVYLTGTTGNPGETINSEANVSLIQYSPHYIDITGLFLGGMVIASLGVLEDIASGQAAAVDEIHKANPKLKQLKVYHNGMSVGREHIAALINTLAILFAGTALPTIVVTVLYTSGQPLAVTLNDETVVDAIVRTIVPSIGLLLAVPLSTALAAYLLPRRYQKTKSYERVKQV